MAAFELPVGAGRLKWRAIWATRVGLPLSLRFLQMHHTQPPPRDIITVGSGVSSGELPLNMLRRSSHCLLSFLDTSVRPFAECESACIPDSAVQFRFCAKVLNDAESQYS